MTASDKLFNDKVQFIKDLRKTLNSPEEQSETEYYFTVIQVDELISSILTFMAICSSVIYYQIHYQYNYQLRHFTVNDSEARKLALDASLALVTILNLFYSKL